MTVESKKTLDAMPENESDMDLAYFAPYEDTMDEDFGEDEEMDQDNGHDEAGARGDYGAEDDVEAIIEPLSEDLKHSQPHTVSSIELFSPSVKAIESDEITKIALDTWLNKKHSAFDKKLLDSIWTTHLLGTGFHVNKLMLLEFNHYLENYLWVHWNDSDSSSVYLMSIIFMINEKFRQKTSNVWGFIEDDPAKFSSFFHAVLKLSLTPLDDEFLSLSQRKEIITFLIHVFESLQNDILRKECLRLSGIASWACLASEDKIEAEVRLSEERMILWEKVSKKTKSSKSKDKMIFEQQYLSNLIIQFFGILSTIPEKGSVQTDSILYCERFLELLIDLESQLSTRRYFNTLFHDHLILPICENSDLAKRGQKNLDNLGGAVSPTQDSGIVFVLLLKRLAFYAHFEINDLTGLPMTKEDAIHARYERIRRIQRVCFTDFSEELGEFAMATVTQLSSYENLEKIFSQVSLGTLLELCGRLGLRTTRIDLGRDATETFPRDFLIELITRYFEEKRRQIDLMNSEPLYPNENDVFNDLVAPSNHRFTNTHSLAIPKLNLQFLTLHDYLLRSFRLFKLEAAYEIRSDIEDAVLRLAPRYNPATRSWVDRTLFDGWARMAVPITQFQIEEVGEPLLTEIKPSFVTAGINYSLRHYKPHIRDEWDQVRPGDTLFLVNVVMEPAERKGEQIVIPEGGQEFKRKFGIKSVRACQVHQLLGENGHPVDDFVRGQMRGRDGRPRVLRFTRTIRVLLDTNQYVLDTLPGKKQAPLDHFNILVRRRGTENNFKSVLETIRDLMQSDLILPSWLHDIFLGYGDRMSAHFTNIPNPDRIVDFRDTFLDHDHLIESFPEYKIAFSESNDQTPPYRLEFPPAMFNASDESASQNDVSERKKKRARTEQASDEIVIHPYKRQYEGPLVEYKLKTNSIRFTPAQVRAIHSGTSKGLTLIVGPPGTGKTDVAVQIIANIYHNNPNERTLLITHSNQALNQLFEKILKLDIEPSHLLRLGHGAEDLDSEQVWGRLGRVNFFLEERVRLLKDVERLAITLKKEPSHADTCETASYFFSQVIEPLWNEYLELRSKEGTSVSELIGAFPFTPFFLLPDKPLFGIECNTAEKIAEITDGCYLYLQKIFDKLSDIRAFELLRTNRDRANYLLTNEARIIAMTCTHAALKRRDLIRLGFKYDNVVMEESAQILEVESFIPLVLQSSQTNSGDDALKRVVMIGDHHQLPPVVKNLAFQKYGNLEQSLFTRFVRLGVPTVYLDKQGRSRPSIADLFRWNYPNLGNLDICNNSEHFASANPGFAFEYQFINVDDFKGVGESAPRPHFLQNLGEAEYVVAVYQYMVLLGYPPEKISILTTYNGQKELILDVLQARCSWNPIFKRPAHISTVDKFQGSQNDFILLSLVRTKSVGHLRDIRRLIVSLSRASLGLYVFGRYKLFSNCIELQPAMTLFSQRPTHGLWLTLGEKYGEISRSVHSTGVALSKKGKEWTTEKESSAYFITNVEHMGKYVYQMAQEQAAYAQKQYEQALNGVGESRDTEVTK